MRVLPFFAIAACSGSKPPGTESGDTGDAPGVCDGLASTTTTAAVPATSTPVEPCPNGGTPDDLSPWGTMLDVVGPCLVCGSPDLTVRITVTNACPVDVTYDGLCGIQEYAVTDGSQGIGAIFDCTLPTTTGADDVTVTAYGEVVYEAPVPGLSEGVWSGSFTVHGFDRPVETRFCVDVP